MKKRLVSLLLISFCSIVLNASELGPQFHLLPEPQSIKTTGGSFDASTIRYVEVPENYSFAIPNNLDCFPRVSNKGAGVSLTITQDGVPEHNEGYVLTISKKGVNISARAQEGLFYGTQTLSQLIQDSKDASVQIPCMVITDYPNLDVRTVHIDTKHHLDRIEYYYRMVDRLSSYKINSIIWELEDKLGYTRHPEVAAGNAISKQEMQALCRYAKEHNVIINPLVQGLGHAPYILKHHYELREDPKSDWEFCPSNPATYDFLFDMYEEAIEAMPYCKYLHIGGDEITAIGIDERCKATGKSAFELQMEWLQKVCDFAKAHGKTPIVWDDMPLKYGNVWWLLHKPLTDDQVLESWDTSILDNAIDMFPKDCVFMRWHYDDPTMLSHRKLLAWYKSHDIKVFAATAASTGETPYIPRGKSRGQYIKDFCSLASENDFDGIMATAWDDESNHYETVMRGFVALGAFSWNGGEMSLEDFLASHSEREWGLDREDVRFIDEMEEAVEFFDHALVDSGVRNPAYGINGRFKLMSLPLKDSAGVWSSKYADKLARARVEEERYARIVDGIKKAKQTASRNRYALDVYEVTNELFHYPVKLMLALEEYDKAEGAGKADALQTVNEVCTSFDVMKERLVSTYGRTRYMEQPYGYKEDLNHHHHLAAWTFNSDWIFYFEMPMTKSVKEWMEESNQSR